MVHIKNSEEIEAMRHGGKILASILKELENFLEPGRSTWDLEKKAEQLFEEHGVQAGFKGYHGYPAILCTSVNEQVVHAIPNKTPLKEGDVLSIDCGVIYKGLNTDSAIACVVGEKAEPAAQKLVDVCKRALWAGIHEIKPGNRLGDIGNAIERVVRQAGFRIIKNLTGHGIGYTLHEDPYVYNYGKRGKGLALKPGMTLAIEPIIVAGEPKIETLEDDWTIVTQDGSLGMQHEHTILVTETGVEVLTLREGETPL